MAKVGYRQSTWNACSFPSTSQRGLWSAVTMDLGVNPKTLHRRTTRFAVQAACNLEVAHKRSRGNGHRIACGHYGVILSKKTLEKGWTTEEHREPKLMLRTEGFNDPPPVIRLQSTAWPGTLPDVSHATIEIASGRP